MAKFLSELASGRWQCAALTEGGARKSTSYAVGPSTPSLREAVPLPQQAVGGFQ